MSYYKEHIESIQDFPKEGILYRDIQPLLENHTVFMDAVKDMGRLVDYKNVKYWVGIESRGFIFASALSMIYGGGVKLIRKSGKLPNENLKRVHYQLEYGIDIIEMKSGSGPIVLVDDIFATGGTMIASEELSKICGYDTIDKLCFMDICIVNDHDVKCLINY
jgi:adenine phosphoribosyltransferase